MSMSLLPVNRFATAAKRDRLHAAPVLRPPPSLRAVGRKRSSSDSNSSGSGSSEDANGDGSFDSLFSGHGTASSASSASDCDGNCISPPLGSECKVSALVQESKYSLPKSRPMRPVRLPVDALATSPTLSASCSPSLTDLLHPHLSLENRRLPKLSVPKAFYSRKSTHSPSSTLFERRRVMRRSERAFSMSLVVSPSFGISSMVTSPTTPTMDFSALELRSPTRITPVGTSLPHDDWVDLWPFVDPPPGVSSVTPPSILTTSASFPERLRGAKDVHPRPAIHWAPTPPALHDRLPARPVIRAAPSPPSVLSPILQLPSPVNQRMRIKRGNSGLLEASPISPAPSSPLVDSLPF